MFWYVGLVYKRHDIIDIVFSDILMKIKTDDIVDKIVDFVMAFEPPPVTNIYFKIYITII